MVNNEGEEGIGFFLVGEKESIWEYIDKDVEEWVLSCGAERVVRDG